MCISWYLCLCNDYYSVYNCIDYARSACDASFFHLNMRAMNTVIIITHASINMNTHMY